MIIRRDVANYENNHLNMKLKKWNNGMQPKCHSCKQWDYYAWVKKATNYQLTNIQIVD